MFVVRAVKSVNLRWVLMKATSKFVFFLKNYLECITVLTISSSHINNLTIVTAHLNHQQDMPTMCVNLIMLLTKSTAGKYPKYYMQSLQRQLVISCLYSLQFVLKTNQLLTQLCLSHQYGSLELVGNLQFDTHRRHTSILKQRTMLIFFVNLILCTL